MEGAKLISALRYENPDIAIDWLCNVLHFQEHVIYRDDEGQVIHAQLVFENAMIMLGPVSDTPYGKLVRLPSQVNGINTQSVYMVVKNVRKYYDHAVQMEAKIELPFQEQDHGGAAFTCRDPGGHLWNIGDYDPWK